MSGTPVVNPNVDDIADRAKHGYATGTKLLAAVQYRLAELACTRRLDPDESMSLQHNLVSLWEALYFGTVCAVRDWDTDDRTWDEADNTYSDGRQVMVRSVSSLETARTSAGSTTESCSMKVRSTSIRSERSATSRA